ncbi:MAG: InlB B-repeat-containing protein, partial [Clostridia bacterium]|nr:InlB B-repeat-containing protein [Clostridia bacterium]
LGWYVGEDLYDFSSPVTASFTLVAKWQYTIVFHTVIFETNGGSAISPVSVERGTLLSRPEDPVRDGFIFVEWQLHGKTYRFDSPVLEDITLVAVYKADGTIPAPTTSEIFIDTGYLEMWADVTLAYQIRTYRYDGETRTSIIFSSQDVTWEFVSSDPTVVTVTADGSITAVGMGDAKVYAIATKAGSMVITDTDANGMQVNRVLNVPVGTVLPAVDVKVVEQPDYYKLAQSQENQKITLNRGEYTINVADFVSFPEGGYGAGNIALWYNGTEGVFTNTVDDNIMSDFPQWNAWLDKYGIPTTFMVISRYPHEVGMTWREQTALGQSVQAHGHFHMASSSYGNVSSSKIWMDFYYGKKDVDMSGANVAITMGYPCGYNDPYISKLLYISGRGTSGGYNYINTINYNYLNSNSGFHQGVIDCLGGVLDGKNIGVWVSVHSHGIGSSAASIDAYLATIAGYVNAGKIWAATYDDAAQYGQERDTATLVVLSADANVMRFTVTDQMNDLLFDQALTIRLKADDTWQGVRAFQNGKEMPARIVVHEGETYLFVDAVPDKGEVTVIRTSVENLTVSENFISYLLTDNSGAYNHMPLTLQFTVNGDVWQNAYAMQNGFRLPATLKTVNGITTLTVIAYPNSGEVTIVPVTDQYAHRTSLSITEVWKGEVTPDGTLPITISTPEELVLFAAYINAGHSGAGLTFVLECDIDMSLIRDFTPIGWEQVYETSSGGYDKCPFSGTFDGKNHTISHLTIESNMCMIGLFGFVENGTVCNVKVEGNVSGVKRVGGLIGHALDATVDNCIFSGTVTNYGIDAHPNTGSMTGGLIGAVASSKITNCGAYADVVAYPPCAYTHMYDRGTGDFSSGFYTGGLIGSAYWKQNHGETTIDNCVFEGNVTALASEDGIGGHYVGGFIGKMDCVVIQNSSSNASVRGVKYVGGFAGMEDGTTRSAKCYNCVAYGTVSGEEYVGGFAGYLYGSRNAGHHNTFTYVKVEAKEGAEYVGAVFGCLRAQNQNPNPTIYYVPSLNPDMVPYIGLNNDDRGIILTATVYEVASGAEALEGLNAYATKNGYQTWIEKDNTITPVRFPIYTVNFVDKDGNILSTQAVPDGMSASAPEMPSYPGLVFAGWDVAFDVVKSDLTVTALYKEVAIFTVTFYEKDGTTIISSVKVNDGEGAVAPTAPQISGMMFVGWSVDFSVVTEDLDVIALYTDAHTVTFVGKDGSVIDVVMVLDGEAAVAPAAPEVEGYRFTGWDVAFDEVKSDLTVTALYKETVDAPIVISAYDQRVNGKHVGYDASKMAEFYALFANYNIIFYTGTAPTDLPAEAAGIWGQVTVKNNRTSSSSCYGQGIAFRLDTFALDTTCEIVHINGMLKFTDAVLVAVPLIHLETGKQVVVVSVFFGGNDKINEGTRLPDSLKSAMQSITTAYPEAAGIIMSGQFQTGKPNVGISDTISGYDSTAWVEGYDLVAQAETELSNKGHHVLTYLTSDAKVTVSDVSIVTPETNYAVDQGVEFTVTLN